MDPVTLDPETTVRNYERWLHLRAGDLLPPTLHRGTALDRDDLVQLGRIAIWRAQKTYDARGALPAYLTMRARGDMLDALRPREKHVVHAEPTTFEAEAEHPALADLAEHLALAYHRGEIAKALDELTPRQREYVQLRFWGDRRGKELTEHFGYDPVGLWRAARDKLSVSLAHLKDAV